MTLSFFVIFAFSRSFIESLLCARHYAKHITFIILAVLGTILCGGDGHPLFADEDLEVAGDSVTPPQAPQVLGSRVEVGTHYTYTFL